MCDRDCIGKGPMVCVGCVDDDDRPVVTPEMKMKACMTCGVDWRDCPADEDCPVLKALLKR